MAAISKARTFKEARKRSGLTLESLAVKLGLTRQAVSFWETGTTVPSGSSRRLLALILGVDLEVVDAWFESGKKAA